MDLLFNYFPSHIRYLTRRIDYLLNEKFLTTFGTDFKSKNYKIFTAYMNIKNNLKSFQIAFLGIYTFIKIEYHGKIHLVSAIIAIALSFYCNINTYEWLFILLAITMVVTLEMINTAIEKTADIISQSYSPPIKIIKDIAAGAVLISAIFAFIVSIIILSPKLYSKLENLFWN